MDKILAHLKICTEMKRTGINVKILKSHEESELLEFFNEIGQLDMREVLKGVSTETVNKLVGDIGFCQIFQWLLEERVALERIQRFLLEYPGEHPSVCEYISLREVMQDEKVPGEYLYEYWKNYKEYQLDDDKKQNLWNGLRFYHARTDQDIEHLSEKEKKLLYDPIFSMLLLDEISDMRQIFAAYEKKGVPELLQVFWESLGWAYRIDRKAFCQVTEESEEIGGVLQEALTYVPKAQQEKFLIRWLENRNLLYDMKKLVYYLPRVNEVEKDKIFDSKVAYLGFLYGNTIAGIPLEKLRHGAENLLTYAITHKKQHFLKMIQKYGEELSYISSHTMLMDEDFYQHLVNLNTLNDRDILDSMGYSEMDDEQKEAMVNPEYTFGEIRCLHNLEIRYIQLYHQISHPRVDDRLGVFREIAKKQCLPEDLSEEEVNRLGKRLSEKKLSVWMRKDFSHIRNLSLETAVRLLIYKEELDRFLVGMKSGLQAEYMLRNRERLLPFATMGEFNQKLLETDEAWLKMKKDFQYSDKLVEENRERILGFLFKGGAEIMTAFYEKDTDSMEKSRRLVTAEILGRFQELKYHEDDLARELSFRITEVQKENWMQNVRQTEKSGIDIWEEDSLVPVMQIGEIPTHTCMSYRSGAQKQCLLSCFDANKKVLFASMQGQVMFRAILRLTKKCSRKIEDGSQQEMEFVDMLEEQGKDEQPIVGKSEKLVLFLEHPYYAGMSPNQVKMIMERVIGLAEKKAEKIGAEMVISTSYTEYLSEKEDYVKEYFYLYISKSKNGSQYLDSLGGSASVSDSGSYRRGCFFVRKLGRSESV